MNKTAVQSREVIQAWGRILAGYRPNLSIEITKECPLRCPGCYAYGDGHLGGDVTLRGLTDYKDDELVDRFMALIDRHRPLHVSIVGGEPLVRYRELDVILPRLAERGIHTQLVTSAVRPIPLEWASIPRLQVVVSIDGLQPEHDARRIPATYDRIHKHIAGHQITVHCTITSQQVRRDGYIEEFLRTWQENSHTRLIWMSLYTPQRGEISAERLSAADRARVIADLRRLRHAFSKLQLLDGMLNVYARPPESPDDCIFAQTTSCVSSDLERRITPCQFGGDPDCSNCGCIASAGLEAIGRHRLAGGLPVGRIFYASLQVGRTVARLRPSAAALS
ncbi:MAG: radical SAM protein [Acidobacteria bacterium RIFCSPLOWO2_12_FULL_67_14]|nr:MAG: radical SAM protein [Acidobacteria bacterium RIFCSPLOWO2_02_FULL_67_21]OFW38454.1 MAG: radical SAM protein [Acidobacteria bacterium RIFCSPLOWO2_12_FULL_67_14]